MDLALIAFWIAIAVAIWLPLSDTQKSKRATLRSDDKSSDRDDNSEP